MVRTTLTVMIAEINADLSERNKISFTAPQTGGTVTTASSERDEEQPRRWVTRAGAVLGALLAIVTLILTVMQVQGWRF